MSTNVCSYVGLNNIWRSVLGDSFQPPTQDQIETMQRSRKPCAMGPEDPQGIRYVVVNGTVVLDQGKHTGTKPGRVLRQKP